MAYKERATILEQIELADGIYSMWLKTEEIAKEAQAGQFVSLYCKEGGSKLLPRPISICELNYHDLRLVYRVTGEHTGTEEFSRLKEGDQIDLIGPLGNGFPKKDGRSLLIGGGIGIPPMLQLAQELDDLEGETQVILGFQDEPFLEDDFEFFGDLYLATETGRPGTQKGNVMDVLKKEKLKADTIYACGPTPMLAAIQKYALEKKIECWLSLEEKMACGIGACLSCVCKSKEKDKQTGVHNKRICKEGPVFSGAEVIL